MHCPLEELERREQQRGDRTIGEGRSHIEEGVHTLGPYDLEVDTHSQSPQENAKLIRAAHANRKSPSAFRRMHLQQKEPVTKAERSLSE